MEAERPKQRKWNETDDPVNHCLAGNSLLLTGLPGTGKTHLARTNCCEAARAGQGGAPGVQDALLRAEPGSGGADGRPLGAQVRARGQRAKAGLAGGGGDHAAGHGALGGPGLRGAERQREVPAAGRQLPAVPGDPSARRWSTANCLAGGHRHKLTENMRSDPGQLRWAQRHRAQGVFHRAGRPGDVQRFEAQMDAHCKVGVSSEKSRQFW